MNHCAFIFLLFFINAHLATAQTAAVSTAETTDIEVFSIDVEDKKPLKTTQQEIAHHYGQFHKRLAVNYNGFIIELLQSELPLSREHVIFQQFGKVYYDKTNEGQYSYCILAENFSSVESLQRYISNMIQHRAPAAAAVEYKNGKRRKKAKDKNCCPGLDKM